MKCRCQCPDENAKRDCNCECHEPCDVSFQDKVNFIWIADVDDKPSAYQRLREGWCLTETLDTFWNRILSSEWYRLHGFRHHRKHQHGEYCEDR